MSKLAKRLLCISALSILALAMGASQAAAGDLDVTCVGPTCGFFAGTNVGSVSTSAIGPSGVWQGNFNENVYYDGTSVYTYVFDLSLTAMKAGDWINSMSTGLGTPVPVANFFDQTLNWGVIFSGGTLPNTSSGVDDAGDAGGTGFSFAGSTLQSNLKSNTLNGSGLTYEFYAQSTLAPDLGTFSILNGGTTNTQSLDPGPEPSTILLFGTGLLILGFLLRRRLPQLPQPL
jgi:hypothetical protein